ncbi:MAG: hypothetical protein KGH75_00505 [Rhodospirillales bacterium]|nr:hypothetical protein [Rhodospirillales bacterium]
MIDLLKKATDNQQWEAPPLTEMLEDVRELSSPGHAWERHDWSIAFRHEAIRQLAQATGVPIKAH